MKKIKLVLQVLLMNHGILDMLEKKQQKKSLIMVGH